ncbi:MAG: tetratricopeptide repeat protein, partial [Clostridiales bacterium]|nr:tetratricopeptide repeat protein [Clostridiales bacterium]
PEQNELFEASRRTPSRGTQSSSIKPGSQQTTRPVNGGKPMSQTTEPARGAKPSSQTTEPVRGTRKPSSQTTEPIYRRRADQDTVLEGSGKPIWDQTTQIEGDQETQLDSSSDGEYQDTELYDSEKETEVDSSRKPKTPAYRPPTSAPTAPTAPSDNYGVPEIDWRLSDIYSLGVTIFHIATGERPPKVPQDKSLFKKRGKFSEGFVYVVDQSTKYYPRDRFPSATVLVQAISNIYRYDNSYKRYHARQVAAGLIIPLAFAAFGASAAFGSFTMAQEKEEVFFSQVYEIETAADPEEPYNVALAMNENRIDPYLAMAKRLWSDGDLGACRDYIEANIARIAEFQDSPTEEAKFGDIYIILGNCYYYQSSDYAAARATFEIAVSRIKDNAALYRDYGISLARLGLIPDAERAIEKAQVLGLESDSLNLLNGELAYAKNDYESALGYFEKAAVSTDSYTAFRAIMTTDDIYKALGQPADSVAVLEGSFTRIPAAMIPQMTERLAIAYQQSGDYTNAIRLFEELVKNGIPQFNIMNSLGVLLQYNKEYDRSAEVFEKMATEFPNDYRVPMRQALMTADRQSQLDNDSRDYSKVKEHYDKAASLYAANVKPGQTDPEMQQLEVIMEQLRIGNWIE